jgi:hypothetical protein
MNMIPDPASLAADPVITISPKSAPPQTPTYAAFRDLPSLAVITRELLTIAAVAGMFWFQIEIVRCFW